MPEYECKCCDFKTHIKTKYTAHLETNKHLKCIEEKHNEKPVENSKTDEITELRQMIMSMNETIQSMKQQIYELTLQVSKSTVNKAETPTVNKSDSEPETTIVRRIKIKSEPKSESEPELEPVSEPESKEEKPKKKRMSADEEKEYIDKTVERLGEDAMEWLADYTPKQKLPKPHQESDRNHPFNEVNRHKFHIIAKLL